MTYSKESSPRKGRYLKKQSVRIREVIVTSYKQDQFLVFSFQAILAYPIVAQSMKDLLPPNLALLLILTCDPFALAPVSGPEPREAIEFWAWERPE